MEAAARWIDGSNGSDDTAASETAATRTGIKGNGSVSRSVRTEATAAAQTYFRNYNCSGNGGNETTVTAVVQAWIFTRRRWRQKTATSAVTVDARTWIGLAASRVTAAAQNGIVGNGSGSGEMAATAAAQIS